MLRGCCFVTHGIVLQVVDVDLDTNQVKCLDDPLPEIPEPELGRLRMDIQQLVHPNLVHLDRARTSYSATYDDYVRCFSKPWNKIHDQELRSIVLCRLLPDTLLTASFQQNVFFLSPALLARE